LAVLGVHGGLGPGVQLVVGLGNPGKSYAHTRHNVGFMVIDRLVQRFGIRVSDGEGPLWKGLSEIQGRGVWLARPLGYMNRSGEPVRGLADALGLSSQQILVIHDDLDLSLGRLKIKEKGGDGGHRGIRSITEALGSQQFSRLRIGIGRCETDSVVDYVLGRFDADQEPILDATLRLATDAVVTVLCLGTKAAMNAFNRKM
jgi:PTH1 family peptidyl-tRNA hydrolase